jgi:hypothetical protein
LELALVSVSAPKKVRHQSGTRRHTETDIPESAAGQSCW